MKRSLNLYIFCSLLFLLTNYSCKNDGKKPKTTSSSNALTYDLKGLSNDSFLLKTTSGNITFKLYSKYAPISTKRLNYLISKGFYDNIKFHRIIKETLIQTGDPSGTGKGGSGKKLPLEISNELTHKRGTIGLARLESSKDSGDSQFYILLEDKPELDGKYTIVGQVISGFEVLDKIRLKDKILNVSKK